MTKKVFITGGARRIGCEISKHFHRQDYSVIIHYNRSQNDATQLMDELNRQRPNSAQIMQADLGCQQAVNQLIEKLKNENITTLINNASTFYPTPIGQIKESDWNNLIDSNVKAALFLSQGLYPQLQKNNGAIINLIDIHASKPMASHTTYCIAKAGLQMMTLSLALEMAPKVRVNGVAPGAILWPENDWPENNSSPNKKLLEKIPMLRSGEPSDIAEAVYFLAHAPYITGQILAVDGGRSLNM